MIAEINPDAVEIHTAPGRIKEFEKGILEKQRENDAEDLSWEKDFLKDLKASSFDNSAFNKWKEKKEARRRKELGIEGEETKSSIPEKAKCNYCDKLVYSS